MIRKAAITFGIIIALIGVLGFIPGITTSDGMLFGIFHVNAVHNTFHILSGLIALIAGYTSTSAARVYFQIFGVIYALLAILGLLYGDNDILGIIANNGADIWLHIIIAIISLYYGFVPDEDIP